MTGEEYARIYSWGNDPNRRGEYEGATPCRHVDLPQTVFEPILIQRATAQGWDVRFRTTFLSHKRESSGKILSTIRDELTETTYQVRSNYLFGCDGGRSQIMRELEIPLIKKPGQGLALNVLVDVDLSEFVDARKGNLHWVFQPEVEYLDYAWSGLIRMVRPWHEWMFILFPKPNATYTEPTEEQWLECCRRIVGKNGAHLPLKILNVSKWYINEIVAEYYSDPTNTIHCLGDAVHRHPPFQRPRIQYLRPRRIQPRLENQIRLSQPRLPLPPYNIQPRTPTRRSRRNNPRQPRHTRPYPRLGRHGRLPPHRRRTHENAKRALRPNTLWPR